MAALGLPPVGPLLGLAFPVPGLLLPRRLLAILGLALPGLFPGRLLRASLRMLLLRPGLLPALVLLGSLLPTLVLLGPGLLPALVLLLHGLAGPGVLLLRGEGGNDGPQQQEHDTQTVRSICFHDGHLHQDGWLRPPGKGPGKARKPRGPKGPVPPGWNGTICATFQIYEFRHVNNYEPLPGSLASNHNE